ncbi:MAG: amidoligase family protein [Polyangiaceae bacterium]
MKTLTFGVEIETVGQDRDTVARTIAQAIGGRKDPYSPSASDAQGRVWKVVTDGSLTGILNGEVVTPILKYDDLDDLLKVVRALAASGARVDQSCSIHIHVGTKHLRPQALANLVKMVHKQERLIEHALGVQERRLGRYCRPVDEDVLRRLERSRPKTDAALNRAWYGRLVHNPDRYHDSRYHGVNLNSHHYRGTTEFRFFEGTLDADKVKAYVQFALALVATARDAKGASSERRPFNPDTAKYDFRCFLLKLGFVGPEFKTARKHLLARLGGSAAWKGARRDKRTRPAPAPPPSGEEGQAAA